MPQESKEIPEPKEYKGSMAPKEYKEIPEAKAKQVFKAKQAYMAPKDIPD